MTRIGSTGAAAAKGCPPGENAGAGGWWCWAHFPPKAIAASVHGVNSAGGTAKAAVTPSGNVVPQGQRIEFGKPGTWMQFRQSGRLWSRWAQPHPGHIHSSLEGKWKSAAQILGAPRELERFLP